MALSAAAAGILAAGSLASAGISAGAGAVGNHKQYKYQSKLQEQAAQLNYKYGLLSLEDSPSATRAGLAKAGYNPMLAVQNATSGANAGWTTTGQAQNEDYASAISQGISNAQSYQRLRNETANTESAVDLNYSNADKAKAEKAALLEKLPFISGREKAVINNIDKDSLFKESQIHNIDETTRFIEKRYELDRMLGLMGIDTQRRGQDKAYNASMYAADVKAETERGTVDTRLPFGVGGRRYYSPEDRKKLYYHSDY